MDHTMPTRTGQSSTDLHDRVRAAVGEEQWQLVRELLDQTNEDWAKSDAHAAIMARHYGEEG